MKSRELDEKVARARGGWAKAGFDCPKCGSTHFGSFNIPGKGAGRSCHDGCRTSYVGEECYKAVPHYSEDIAAAWELVEEEQLTVTPSGFGGWDAYQHFADIGYYVPGGSDKSAARAICLAYLKAKGASDATDRS